MKGFLLLLTPLTPNLLLNEVDNDDIVAKT